MSVHLFRDISGKKSRRREGSFNTPEPSKGGNIDEVMKMSVSFFPPDITINLIE